MQKGGFYRAKTYLLQHKNGVFGKWLIFRWLRHLYILKSYGATQGGSFVVYGSRLMYLTGWLYCLFRVPKPLQHARP